MNFNKALYKEGGNCSEMAIWLYGLNFHNGLVPVWIQVNACAQLFQTENLPSSPRPGCTLLHSAQSSALSGVWSYCALWCRGLFGVVSQPAGQICLSAAPVTAVTPAGLSN